jgi:hypothetical protein
MSTRSQTIVNQVTQGYEGNTLDELFRFYRHCDGYPEGHGCDVATACVEALRKGTEKHTSPWGYEFQTLNNRNWAQHVFGELFNMDCDLELEPMGTEHGDIDYLYVITGTYAAFGGKVPQDELPVIISIYSPGWDEPFDEVMSGDPVFRGTAAELLEKYGR